MVHSMLGFSMMQAKRSQGMFVVLEGADGSGKSTLADLVVEQLRRDGYSACVTQRNNPEGYGHPTYSQYISAVVKLFRAESPDDISFDLLSLAAAAQYTAILDSQVRPFVTQGGIIIADSWWDKVWIRLGLEAQRCLQLSDSERDTLWAWQRTLFPPPHHDSSHLTILVDAAVEDRIRWHVEAGCPEVVYDAYGVESREPEVFGEFTSRIAAELAHVAAARNWPVVSNTCTRDLHDVAKELVAITEKYLESRSGLGPVNSSTDRVVGSL